MVPSRFKVMITTWNSKQPVFNGRLLKQQFPIERFGNTQLKQPFKQMF